jgi:hypothetical protein
MKYNLDAPGWMSFEDLEILNRLASCVPENGNILEVGCFTGRSTLALFYGKPASAKLEVVDTFEVVFKEDCYYPVHIDRWNIDGSQSKIQAIKEIAEQTGSWLEAFKYCVTPEIFDQITVNISTSYDYKITKHFDMIFIDANHHLEDVLYDIRKYSTENTLIVGDDFCKKHTGVVQALVAIHEELPKTLVVPANSKIWILVPKTPHWSKVFAWIFSTNQLDTEQQHV